MRRSVVRRPMMRHRLRDGKTLIARDERLGLWVESVPVETPRDWVLAFRIGRVGRAG